MGTRNGGGVRNNWNAMCSENYTDALEEETVDWKRDFGPFCRVSSFASLLC